MAVITPNTDLYLLKVPLEIDDVNQLTFANVTAQYNYFNSLPKLAVDDFTYQRKDGTIRFGASFDDILTYNYVMYRNDAYSNKWFYAYITNMEYVNDGLTAIQIKTDVWQTWQFNLTYKPVFVEREHVNDDTVGANTVPENLELGEYQIVDLRNSPMYETSSPSADWMPCFAVTKLPTGTASIAGDNQNIGGVFNSLYFFAVRTFGAAQYVIEYYENDQSTTTDAIVNMYMVPACCVNIDRSTGNLATGGNPSNIGLHAIYPLYNYYESDSFKLQQPSVMSGNYYPTNKKLLTYPFSYFYVTNNSGETISFHYEDFPIEQIGDNVARTMTYKKGIVPSASLSGKLYFTNYKTYSDSSAYGSRLYEYSINYAKVPVCAWTTDYYTNWLTQNGVNVGVNIAKDVLLGAGGAVASGMLTGGIGGFVGGAMGIANAAGNIASQLAQMHSAEVTPPQAQGNINTGDFNYAFLRNSITFYEMSIKREMAVIIDNYFSAYGYQVNRIKLPNITGRRNWNYVKTQGCYIDADIPQADLDEIKRLFDRGVTFWHNPATFADYSQNNDII